MDRIWYPKNPHDDEGSDDEKTDPKKSKKSDPEVYRIFFESSRLITIYTKSLEHLFTGSMNSHI